jgi:hypothetical protein
MKKYTTVILYVDNNLVQSNFFTVTYVNSREMMSVMKSELLYSRDSEQVSQADDIEYPIS